MTCTECQGTRLATYGEYRGKRLYTSDECLTCGGKGYQREGEEEYTVGLFSDEVRIYQFFVLARHAAEALFLAAEMCSNLQPGLIKPGEEACLVVSEKES